MLLLLLLLLLVLLVGVAVVGGAVVVVDFVAVLVVVSGYVRTYVDTCAQATMQTSVAQPRSFAGCRLQVMQCNSNCFHAKAHSQALFTLFLLWRIARMIGGQ